MPPTPHSPLIFFQHFFWFQDLKKHYGGRRCKNILEKISSSKSKESRPKMAISGLTFAVSPGEVFGLLGHNGAGKSTTLKILTSEEYPDSGQVIYDFFMRYYECKNRIRNWKN